MSKLRPSSLVLHPLRWPLHYQILVAMVLGAVVGLFVNPGEKQLDDATVVIEREGERIVVTRRFPVQPPDTEPAELRDEFPNLRAFGRRFPDLAEVFTKDDDDDTQTQSLTVHVIDRRVHLSEDGTTVTLRYIRRQNGRRAVTTYEAKSLNELTEKYPAWRIQYKEAISWYTNKSARYVAVWSKFVGDLFLRLLRMITVPLIVTSLVVGVSGLGQTRRLGSMFGKTLLYYVTTSLLAVSTGILMVNLVRPGVNAELPGGGQPDILQGEQSLADVFVNLVNSMIPPNPVHALAEGDFLSIITFSILVGLFIIKVGGDSGRRLQSFFQAGFDVMMEMTQAVIKLAPVGVLAFMLFATTTQGLEIFKTFALYMLTVFLALLFHAVITLPLILRFVARRSPWEYSKAMVPALLTAFSTASSNGTLPLTMTSVEERAGVSNRVSSFVLPLGATINMDGTALYEAVAVLFIAQSYTGGLTLGQQIVVAVTALLASVGAAGIPSAGLVMMAIVLQAVGLPIEAVGLIIAVDRVLDMGRTSVNVWSDSCGCAVLSRFEPDDGAEAEAASRESSAVPASTGGE